MQLVVLYIYIYIKLPAWMQKPFVKKCKSEKTQRKDFRTNWRIVDQVNYRLSQSERNKELKNQKWNIFSCLCLRYRSIKFLRIYPKFNMQVWNEWILKVIKLRRKRNIFLKTITVLQLVKICIYVTTSSYVTQKLI